MTAPTSTLTDLLAPAAAGAATPAAAVAVAPEDFTGAFRAYAGGVAVITADAGAGPVDAVDEQADRAFETGIVADRADAADPCGTAGGLGRARRHEQRRR